jgi:hypothetical protein
MLITLSRAYVYTFVPLIVLLIAILLTFHVAMLAGSHFEPNGHFYALWFGINIPILAFAKDRNIWAHEVKQSPRWLSITFRCLFGYCMVVALLCIFLGNMHIPADFFLTTSAFMLAFTFGSACVLWVTVQSAKSDTSDLLQRARRSLFGVALISAFYLVAVLFPPKPLHY